MGTVDCLAQLRVVCIAQHRHHTRAVEGDHPWTIGGRRSLLTLAPRRRSHLRECRVGEPRHRSLLSERQRKRLCGIEDVVTKRRGEGSEFFGDLIEPHFRRTLESDACELGLPDLELGHTPLRAAQFGPRVLVGPQRTPAAVESGRLAHARIEPYHLGLSSLDGLAQLLFVLDRLQVVDRRPWRGDQLGDAFRLVI